MKKMLLNVILPLIGVLIFNTLGMTAHASMNSSHGSSNNNQTLSCASLCLNLPANRGAEDKDIHENDDEDEYVEPSFFALLEPISEIVVHENEAYLATKFDPPPGPPGYILHAVFRV
jgi:hypothetical protein